MNLFLNLTTRSKLLLGFCLMLLLLAGVIETAYRNIVAMQTSLQELYSADFADAVELRSLRSHENAVRADVLSMMLLLQRHEQEVWHQDIKERSLKIDQLLQQLLVRHQGDQEITGKLKELSVLRDAYVQTRDTQIIPLIYGGKLEEAKTLALGTQAARYEQLRVIAETLGDDAEKRAQAAVERSRQRADESVQTFFLIGAAALLLGVAMALLLTHIIANPLKQFAGMANRVAAGDLSVDMPASRRTDEVGLLAQSFRAMVEGLRQLTLEIREGMNVLGTSSSEILATTTQVASGAAETATAVSETTATVEEVKQTVQLANQKARQVSDSAQQAAQVSQTGRQAVEAMITGMNRIREQTAATADSIVRLSEQSQVIGEIIATVNDLAEQSNLLAVNAAIEAAKAGEQGKGFVVVAQEIKSLAEQSKQATAQVRSILGDIQKATGAAVMATDLSGRAVDAGAQQSDAAGEAIRLLAESMAEAAQAALQIAASSQQQLVGMDQVALAMENIKQASTQNMAGTRQAEAAAQGLHELGVKLKQLVGQR